MYKDNSKIVAVKILKYVHNYIVIEWKVRWFWYPMEKNSEVRKYVTINEYPLLCDDLVAELPLPVVSEDHEVPASQLVLATQLGRLHLQFLGNLC